MSDTPDRTAATAVNEELAAIVSPLRAQLDILNADIEEKKAELDGLRETRGRVEKTIAFLDPSTPKRTAKKARTGGRGHGGIGGVSWDAYNVIEKWLREHSDEINANGGMNSREIMRAGFTATSRATLTKALHALHEQGVIRLDHTGSGGGLFYKVVG
jgi:hypothetical protein